MKVPLFSSLKLMLLTLCLFGQSISANAQEKPNVVFFLVDDLGWADTASNGSKIYQTPNIDALAKEGMSFTGAYAAHPLCIGSRFALMTGKYPARIKKSKQFGTMPPNEKTMAEAFKEQGYSTFFAGKWHLGKPGAYPENQGFDINVGGHDKGAPAHYFYPYGDNDNDRKVPGLDLVDKKGDYLTDSLTEKANAFIRKNQDKPFFLYLSHYAVHVPIESKEIDKQQAQQRIDKHEFIGPAYKALGPAKQKMHQDNATYAGMIKSIDDSLGNIVKQLDALNLSDNTIIVFTSDNGGESTKTTAYGGKATSNLPLKAGKCWLYEGGIRVPLVVKWPGKIAPNSASNHSVAGTDHYPTLLNLASLPEQASQHIDGQSYANTLLNKSQTPRPAMFWHFRTQGNLARVCGTPSGTVINDGKHKLINWYDSGNIELYNVNKDIGETNNIADKKPKVTQRLMTELQAWQDNMGIAVE
ncbi:MAG: sulfatase [Colwellia sp.]|uniref:sulfatase n=1 Tax=Colwellia sp. TaxID=56799 RepID=UPI0025C57D99|nr:sulfatase [Colwellia sp.]NQZ27924.1 sulfatase [Colwellia sp.]